MLYLTFRKKNKNLKSIKYGLKTLKGSLSFPEK